MTARNYQALTAAVAAWLAILVAFVLHLEIPYWSGITAWIVISIDRQDVLQKGIGQAVATIVAAFIGYGLATVIEGSVVLQLVVIVFAISFGTWERHTSKAPLAWIMGTLMAMVLLVESIISPASVETVAIYRTYEMLTGVVTATAVAFAFQYRHRHAEKRTKAAPPPGDRAIIVSGPDIKAMRAMAWERIAGCITGGTAGILVVGLSVQSLWIWSLQLLTGLFVAGNFHHTNRPHATVGTLSGIVFMLAMVGNGAPQVSLQLPIDVVADITLASLVLGLLLLLAEPWMRPDDRNREAATGR